MKHKCALLLVLAIVGAAEPTFAQSAPPPSPPPPPPPPPPPAFGNAARNAFDQDYTTKVLLKAAKSPAQEYAAVRPVVECLIRRNRDGAGSLVSGPMTADENFGSLAKALSGKYSRCVDAGSAGISMATVNGVLAEELVRNSSAPLAPRAANVDVTAAQTFYAATPPTMASVGRCISVYSPGLAKAVLLTTPQSPQEKSALEQVYARTPECGLRVPPNGIPSIEQRGAIASGLYLWTHRG